MKHTKLSTRSLLAGALAAVLYLGPAAAWATCGGTLVAVPYVGSYDVLTNVSAVSATSAWAVGYYLNGTAWRPLIEHWNGTKWSVVPSPNVDLGSTVNTDVAALSSTNAWVVGSYFNGTVNRTLIEHWNGTSWSVVPSPNIGTKDNGLTGVAPLSSSAIWAVGAYYNGTNWQTLTEYWNGSKWTAYNGADVGSGSLLSDVAAVPGYNRAWAVGDSYYRYRCHSQSGMCTSFTTLIEFWPTPSGWATVASPVAGAWLSGVTSIPGTLTAWAVGGGYATNPPIEKWNGSSWVAVASPTVGFCCDSLSDVAATGPTNAWAVGRYSGGSADGNPLALHWNGATWSAITTPNPGGVYGSFLNGVTAIPGSAYLWAIGTYETSSAVRPLAELLHC